MRNPHFVAKAESRVRVHSQRRKTVAEVAATLAGNFDLAPWPGSTAILPVGQPGVSPGPSSRFAFTGTDVPTGQDARCPHSPDACATANRW